tara:strand:- start:66 stop:620 length:555 start_codon:yes stop_codon:yes gene_type:complete
MKNLNQLIILTGPSGVGKGTIIEKIIKKDKRFWLSISATTRKPREGEVEGENYYFLSKSQFEEMIDKELLIEWAKFADNYYGTLLKPVIEKINKGFKVILEIEVEGAEQIRKKFPEALSIFLMPPSKNELEKRIRNRGTENEDSIIKRLDRASFEIDSAKEFDYVFTNLDVDETAKKILEVITL